MWFFKTVIISAGLIAGGGAIAKMISPDHTAPTYKEPDPSLPKSLVTVNAPAPAQAAHSFKPSGMGEQVHPNDENSIWTAPMYGGSIKNTLLTWAREVYPELTGREAEISSLPSFTRIVNIFSQNNSSSSSDMTVPQGYSKIKDVVDLFIGDLKNATTT